MLLWKGHQSMSQAALFWILTTKQVSALGQLSDHFKVYFLNCKMGHGSSTTCLKLHFHYKQWPFPFIFYYVWCYFSSVLVFSYLLFPFFILFPFFVTEINVGKLQIWHMCYLLWFSWFLFSFHPFPLLFLCPPILPPSPLLAVNGG